MQHFIASYGYAAVFLLMLAESACIPVPSEVIMLFGGALAAGAVHGAHPSLAGIIAAGAAGNVAGSYLAWAAGLRWGQAALHRWGRRLGLREHDLDRAIGWFGKYGPAAVFFGRLVPVVRTFISLPAGFARMPAARFGAYTAAGCIPWTAGLAAAGYALGRNWQTVSDAFHGPTYIIAAVLVVALAVALFRLRARASAARTGTAASSAARSGTAQSGTALSGSAVSGSAVSGTARQDAADPAPAGRPQPGRPQPGPEAGWDWPGGDRQRRALRQAVGAAEFAVLEAQQAGAQTGELGELCRRLRAAAWDARSSPSPALSAPVPGRPPGQSASVIGDLLAAARMIQDAAATTARSQARARPADSLDPQAEAIAARIASAAHGIARISAADSQP